MESDSPDDVTRWGTSVQLTQRGVNAVRKLWTLDDLERVVSPQDRIDAARNVRNPTNVSSPSFDGHYKFRWNKAWVEKNGNLKIIEIQVQTQ